MLGPRLGRTVQFVEVEWTGQIDALLAGRTDIVMSGMSITDARRVRVAFSQPYLEGGLMAAVRADDRNLYPSPEALLAAPATVGVLEGTTGAVFVQRSFPNARRVELSRASDGALALRRRTIDVFVHDAPSIAWLVSANEADVAAIRHYPQPRGARVGPAPGGHRAAGRGRRRPRRLEGGRHARRSPRPVAAVPQVAGADRLALAAYGTAGRERGRPARALPATTRRRAPRERRG